MWGYLLAALAGAAMSVQGVWNTRLGERIGTDAANAWVQGTAFMLAVAVLLLRGGGKWDQLLAGPKLYLLGGVLGLISTLTVMQAIGALSPTVAICVILIAQLLVAALIDAFGLWGTEQAVFGWNKYAGIGLMVAAVLLFKWK